MSFKLTAQANLSMTAFRDHGELKQQEQFFLLVHRFITNINAMGTKMWIGALLLCTVFASCDDQENNQKKNTAAIASQVESTAIKGSQWRITYFVDSETEATSRFNGYIFSFDPGNMIIATNGSANYSGNWQVGDSEKVTAGDAALQDVDFDIEFSSPDDFEDLNEDWEIVSLNDSKIELRHRSGGNAQTDFLTFERI